MRKVLSKDEAKNLLSKTADRIFDLYNINVQSDVRTRTVSYFRRAFACIMMDKGINKTLISKFLNCSYAAISNYQYYSEKHFGDEQFKYIVELINDIIAQKDAEKVHCTIKLSISPSGIKASCKEANTQKFLENANEIIEYINECDKLTQPTNRFTLCSNQN